MKQRPDLNKLSKEIYEANKAKGFHDEEHSDETLLMLVITELSEAVEADRKSKRSDNDYSVVELYRQYNIFNSIFETLIKDTVEDELADAVIRLLDLAGLREVSFRCILPAFIIRKNDSFPENIYAICKRITKIDECKYKVADILSNIEGLCKSMNIDLWYHIELKLQYNTTRPNKHGKEY